MPSWADEVAHLLKRSYDRWRQYRASGLTVKANLNQEDSAVFMGSSSKWLNRFRLSDSQGIACRAWHSRGHGLVTLMDDNPRPRGPRIQDVARRAGVAIGTVSNVLNNPDIVTEHTRLKVEAAIAEVDRCSHRGPCSAEWIPG